MLASAYEPTAIDQWRKSPTKGLSLTPRKVEARTDLRPGVPVTKEIGDSASAKITEQAPIPKAAETIATAAKPGSFRSARTAKTVSCARSFSQRAIHGRMSRKVLRTGNAHCIVVRRQMRNIDSNSTITTADFVTVRMFLADRVAVVTKR